MSIIARKEIVDRITKYNPKLCSDSITMLCGVFEKLIINGCSIANDSDSDQWVEEGAIASYNVGLEESLNENHDIDVSAELANVMVYELIDQLPSNYNLGYLKMERDVNPLTFDPILKLSFGGIL